MGNESSRFALWAGMAMVGVGCSGAGEAANPSAGEAPVVLSFKTDVTSLQEGGSVTFSAVLTHPLGVEALRGGTLIDPETGDAYGAFRAGPQNGEFEILVPWSQINTGSGVNSAWSQHGPRSFVAHFVDESGGSAEASVTLTLAGKGWTDGGL
jgi:hypothetical protein